MKNEVSNPSPSTMRHHERPVYRDVLLEQKSLLFCLLIHFILNGMAGRAGGNRYPALVPSVQRGG